MTDLSLAVRAASQEAGPGALLFMVAARIRCSVAAAISRGFAPRPGGGR